MIEKISERLKKFEQDHEVYVDAQDAKSYWFAVARIPRTQKDLHHIHYSKRYISGLNEEGNVLVFPDPEMNERYTVENWGKMDTFDIFVDKALARILEEKEESDKGLQEGCGTSCS